MADTCTHLDTVREVTPSAEGCEDCLRTGGRWVGGCTIGTPWPSACTTRNVPAGTAAVGAADCA